MGAHMKDGPLEEIQSHGAEEDAHGHKGVYESRGEDNSGMLGNNSKRLLNKCHRQVDIRPSRWQPKIKKIQESQAAENTTEEDSVAFGQVEEKNAQPE